MPRRKPPELSFQKHIAAYLAREHHYSILEQTDITDITDIENAIAEEHLWRFITATQPDMLRKLSDDYGTDARDEIFRALRKEMQITPLWMLMRKGLTVRGLEFRLFYPKPRSIASTAAAKYTANSITFKPHYYFGDTNQEIDFVLFLNGLPIVVLEVKHEKNQNIHDAVAQYVARDHSHGIFRHPFLYLAADTSEVMAATDPRRAENFRWHNSGLTNIAQSSDEYPVEFLYREVLSSDHLLEALSFFLIRVPERQAAENRQRQAPFTIFPRYHQSRMVRKVAADVQACFAATGNIGRKYLIDHSAGSGKTLSICWLADTLHSLYKAGTNDKLIDTIFIFTDRKSLDRNIRDDMEKFTHLKDVVGIARKADDLPRFMKLRRSIIITTQQKFAWVLEELTANPALKTMRVAFLIDEAHRSQEGSMGAAIRVPFRTSNEPDQEDAAEDRIDEEDKIAAIIREHDYNQLFVAFTATPAPATLSLFGHSFDSYTEAEAITEGYIVDVATSIISYKTLYHLHCPIIPTPDQEATYPKGVVSKALQNVAYQDDGLIQFKAEVMLRIFEKDILPLIEGKAKAMIVTTSRVAGLRYFEIIREKLQERSADYKVLYAFSDFFHPATQLPVSEHMVNHLNDRELIEDRFEGDDYRLMVVANKFQTGFDQPLLAGMFIDKPIADRNAVQTVSRLNRCHEGKQKVVVVDFTNNAADILRAFTKYRKGTPFAPEEPDKELCVKLYGEIMDTGVFSKDDISRMVAILAAQNDAQAQFLVNALRVRFQAMFGVSADRKNFILLLNRYVKYYHFLTCFFTYPSEYGNCALFAEFVGPQLVKQGIVSELMKQIRVTEVIKATVQYQGEVRSGGDVSLKPRSGNKGVAPPLVKISVQDLIDEIRRTYTITDEEALFIKQVTKEKVADPSIRETVHLHRGDKVYLDSAYRGQVNGEIQECYNDLGRIYELADPKYTDTGGIFDIMAITVINTHLSEAA